MIKITSIARINQPVTTKKVDGALNSAGSKNPRIKITPEIAAKIFSADLNWGVICSLIWYSLMELNHLLRLIRPKC